MPCNRVAAATSRRHAVRHRDELRARGDQFLGVAARHVHPGDALTGAGDDARALGAGNRRGWGAVAAGALALVDVHEVDAGGLDADDDLVLAGSRLGHAPGPPGPRVRRCARTRQLACPDSTIPAGGPPSWSRPRNGEAECWASAAGPAPPGPKATAEGSASSGRSASSPAPTSEESPSSPDMRISTMRRAAFMACRSSAAMTRACATRKHVPERAAQHDHPRVEQVHQVREHAAEGLGDLVDAAAAPPRSPASAADITAATASTVGRHRAGRPGAGAPSRRCSSRRSRDPPQWHGGPAGSSTVCPISPASPPTPPSGRPSMMIPAPTPTFPFR